MFWYDVAICLSDSYIHRAVVDFDCRACNLRPLIVSQLAIRCWHWQSRRGYIIVGVASNTIGVCFALMSEIATQESSTFEHHFSFKYIQSSIRAQLLRSEWVLNHTWKTCRCDCVAHCIHLSVLLLTLSLMAPIFFRGASSCCHRLSKSREKNTRNNGCVFVSSAQNCSRFEARSRSHFYILQLSPLHTCARVISCQQHNPSIVRPFIHPLCCRYFTASA